jgi:hypothetical protein
MLMCVPEGHSTNLRSDDNDPSGRLSCPTVAAATLSLWKSQLLLLSGALSSCCPTVAATATRESWQLLLRSSALSSCPAVTATATRQSSQLLLRSGALSSCPAVDATTTRESSQLLLRSGALSSCPAVAATTTRGSSQLLLRSGATGDDNLDGRRVAHVAHRGVDPWLSSTGPGGNRDYVPLAGKDTIFAFCHLVRRFQNEDRINIHGA